MVVSSVLICAVLETRWKTSGEEDVEVEVGCGGRGGELESVKSTAAY